MDIGNKSLNIFDVTFSEKASQGDSFIENYSMKSEQNPGVVDWSDEAFMKPFDLSDEHYNRLYPSKKSEKIKAYKAYLPWRKYRTIPAQQFIVNSEGEALEQLYEVEALRLSSIDPFLGVAFRTKFQKMVLCFVFEHASLRRSVLRQTLHNFIIWCRHTDNPKDF